MNENMKIKTEVVKEISNKINSSQSLVVAKYAGLTVKEFQDLRAQLAEKDVELKVYKNRLFKIAAREANLEELEESLTGANVFAFGMSDDISPAKILANFAKNHKALELKAGTYEGKVLDTDGINSIATLPSFEEALTILANQLMSPVKFIGVGLHQLTEGDFLESSKEKEVVSESKESDENNANTEKKEGE
ncbi:MAG: 50S ribosomal protein L10 [Mycoplasmatales bacterium]|nr:50S ribosomal protein L10 [Mycoplasmatales bacterium]